MVDRGRAQDVNEAARSFAETLAESYRVVYGQAAESAERQQQRAREFSEAVSINRHFSPRGAMTPTLGRGQCSCQDTLTTISTAAKKTGLRGEGSSAWNGPRGSFTAEWTNAIVERTERLDGTESAIPTPGPPHG